MAKTITLKQLALKKYVIVDGMPPELVASIGEIEDAFDAIVYGPSNNGKSSFIAAFLLALIKALDCRCEYVAYEEAHGRTVQATMIDRYNMYEELGNKMQITDHYTYKELDERMNRKKSAKIWVIDSIQAAKLTADQINELKRKYVTSKKRKILIMISWSEGKTPQGAVAKAVEYLANIKMRVQDLIMFPKSRYGGGSPYIIHAETAIKRLGEKQFRKLTGIAASKALKAGKPKQEEKVEVLEMDGGISM